MKHDSRFQRTTRAWLLILSALLLLAACTTPAATATEPTEAPAAAVTEEPAAESSATIPEHDAPDKSDLPYIDAWEPYKKTDWTAAWIWTPSSAEDSYVAFRRTFTLDSAVESATAYISAESKYTLWLNGELIVLDGSFKRGPSPVDCYYDEITLRDLKASENTIVALVAFNGRGGYSSVTPIGVDEFGDPAPQAGFLFEAEIGGQRIVSDASWKALRVPTYRNFATARGEYINHPLGTQLAERNIWFDARQDVGDWTSPSFDDSTWEAATLIAKPGHLPFGDTYRSELLTPKFGELTDFLNAAEFLDKPIAEDTTIALQLPKNMQFTFAFTLEADEGKVLALYTDSHHAWGDGIESFMDSYVTKSGTQSYEQYPWRSGSILYIDVPAGVTFTSLQYRASGLNAEHVGSFTSSDDSLDLLWEKAANTVDICIRDAFMDCPDRERAAYAGDAANEGAAAMYLYDEAGLLVLKKALLTSIGWTHSNNVIPSQAPGNVNRELPNQTLSMITASYLYWLHSGDEQTMRAFYPAAVNYLMLYEMQDGMPQNRAGDWNWCDWGDWIDCELLQVAFYYECLNLMDQLAEDLAITDGRAELQERIASIKTNYRDKYYTEDGFKSANAKRIDERANAMMALSGLCEASDYEMIVGIIASTEEASPFMERFILETLGELGETEAMIARVLRRYGPMLEDEGTTLWENFAKEDGTFNHGWSAGPLYVLSKYVAGIRPTSVGWAAYEIRPSSDLDSFSCTVWTPKGVITVEKTGSTLTITAVEGGTLVLADGTRIALTVGTATYSMK